MKDNDERIPNDKPPLFESRRPQPMNLLEIPRRTFGRFQSHEDTQVDLLSPMHSSNGITLGAGGDQHRLAIAIDIDSGGRSPSASFGKTKGKMMRA